MAERREDIINLKLYCPSTCKLVSYAALVTDRIDLGGIGRIFGLEPASVKLNGHFIGRGPDLVASSVTWRALIKFFCDRGLPTGIGGGRPLLVSGKILKPPNKRLHDPSDGQKLDHYVRTKKEDAFSAVIHSDAIGASNKKPKLRNAGNDDVHIKNGDRHCYKRKHLLEDITMLKKLKISETSSGESFQCEKSSTKSFEGQGRKQHNLFNKPLNPHYTCCYLSQQMKQTQEGEAVVAVTPKVVK